MCRPSGANYISALSWRSLSDTSPLSGLFLCNVVGAVGRRGGESLTFSKFEPSPPINLSVGNVSISVARTGDARRTKVRLCSQMTCRKKSQGLLPVSGWQSTSKPFPGIEYLCCLTVWRGTEVSGNHHTLWGPVSRSMAALCSLRCF